MISTDNFKKIEVHSAQELRDWLLTHFDQCESVWLVTFKKSVPDKYISTSEVLDELLCFGWIDGIRRKLDEQRSMQLISPRKAQHWAKTYKERVARLTTEGRMHDSGLQSVKDAKASGLWDFMNDVDDLIIPKDLTEALAQDESARAFFESINDSSMRFVLRWVKLAKTETTRQKRICELFELSRRGEKLKGS